MIVFSSTNIDYEFYVGVLGYHNNELWYEAERESWEDSKVTVVVMTDPPLPVQAPTHESMSSRDCLLIQDKRSLYMFRLRWMPRWVFDCVFPTEAGVANG